VTVRQWSADPTATPDEKMQEIARILEEEHGGRQPTTMLLHPTTYYRLRSPASRVGPDGNFAGPTRARMYRTRKSRKR
jgi:hypothetical protein